MAEHERRDREREWMERLIYDVRYAIRIWLANPGLSTVAVLTIALGIGASTALVAQINAVFWTPLSVSEPAQLRQLAWSAARYPYVLGGALNAIRGPKIDGLETLGSISHPAYEAVRNESTSVSDIACWGDFGEARPVMLGELGFGAVQFVSGNYFRTLGVRAALGRTIQPEDDGSKNWSPVAMIGYRFWQRVYGGDSAVTQRTIKLNGRTFTIVGVVPESFSGLDPATSLDVVVPMGAAAIAAQTVNPLENRGIWSPCRVVARLRPGASEDRARGEIERALAAHIAVAPPPEPYDPPRVHLLDGSRGLSTLRQAATAPLAILLAGVGALLLAACANIAGLLLARCGARQREIATRLALGAPRLRLIRQLVTESLVLSSIGGAIGIVLAFALSGTARTLLGQFLPTLFGADRSLGIGPSPDLRVLAVAVIVTMVCGLLFGISPALQATRGDLIGAIRQVRAGRESRGRWTSGPILVAAQTMLAVTLLVSSGLFLQTLVNLRSSDLGFATERVLYARVEPRSGNLPQPRRAQFFEDAVTRVAQLPGVVAAAAATRPPFIGDTNLGAESTLLACFARPVNGRTSIPVAASWVSPGYFATLGVDVLAGRDFTWADRPAAANAPVVVNETFARQTFGVAAAAGQTFAILSDCQIPTGPAAQLPIIGVVRDIRSDSRAPATPAIYAALGGVGVPTTLVIRTTDDPATMIAAVRKAVTGVNADIPTFSEAPLAALRDRAFRRERLLSTLLGGFATVTLLVSALGIYGLLSYAVMRRRSEIGIRMAIGADARAVIALIVRDSLAAVVGGIAAGLGAAFLINRVLDSMFFGVTPGDPTVMLSAAAVFLIVAIAAAALPARSATRVDPVLSLRT